MATSAIPNLVDALFTQATAALPTTLVIDGFGVTNDANPNVLMIGVDDVTTDAPANSAQAGQQNGPAGTTRPRDETGTITCAALSWSGDGVQKTVRDAAFATVAAVEAMLRADPRLGLVAYQSCFAQMGEDLRLSQNQYAATDTTTGGVDALVIFTVAFKVRI